MEYYLITFSSTHAAITAQKYLKDKLSFQVMPTLREISSSCGISLKISSNTLDEIMDCIKQQPLEENMYKIYYMKGNTIKELI